MLAVALVALVVGVGCRSDDTVARFCDDLAAMQAAGPIFPARADGAREPDLAALDRLRSLAERAPDEIEESLQILAEHAEELVQTAQTRTESGSSFSPSGRWSRSVVESAQTAVSQYAAATCDIDLAG